jgi:hypothetical protein
LTGRIDEAAHLYDTAYARWPESEVVAANAICAAARTGDGTKVQRLIAAWSEGLAETDYMRTSIRYARNLLEPDRHSLTAWLDEERRELERTGAVRLHSVVRLHAFGLTQEAFELIDRASFEGGVEREGPSPSVTYFRGEMFGRSNEAMIRDPRFLRLCGKLGLVPYWIETGRWPDCADEVGYDFRSAARSAATLSDPAGERTV